MRWWPLEGGRVVDALALIGKGKDDSSKAKQKEQSANF